MLLADCIFYEVQHLFLTSGTPVLVIRGSLD